MPNKTRTHITNDAPTGATTPKHLSRQEFGRRLYKLMLKKGWNQSELGRQSGLPRDAISTYIRGHALPTPAKLGALAQALGVTDIALLPNLVESAIDEDAPAFELRASTSAPDTAWLRVNRLVTMSTAVKIAQLLEADRAADGTGSGEPSAV